MTVTESKNDSGLQVELRQRWPLRNIVGTTMAKSKNVPSSFALPVTNLAI